MIYKAGITIVLLLTIYLVSLMWSDKNDHLFKKANIVLFTVDTLRADHLSIYGYNRNTSPNLASIISDSVIFDNAYSVATYSAPAYASLLTGLYPLQFNMGNNNLIIPSQIETLAEILQKKGYVTAAFVGDSVIGKDGNFNQGFSTFSLDQIQSDTTISVTKLWAERGWKKARNWLEKWHKKNQPLAAFQQQPFFLWFHANHPHGNYSPPPQYRNLFIKQAPEEVKHLQSDPNFSLDSLFRQHIQVGEINQNLIDWVEAQYDGEIAFSDYLFGQLVDFLKTSGEYNNTHIIFIADHGEVLFEHWRPGKIRSAGHHANLYYQSVLKIPLVIKPAVVKPAVVKSGSIKPERIVSDIVKADTVKSNFAKGQRVNSLVSSVDIFNSILHLVNLNITNNGYGKSLVPLLINPAKLHHSQIFFSGQAYNNHCSGLLDKQWQLVQCKMNKQVKLTVFDLKKDPLQLVNTAPQLQQQQVKRLQQLIDWQNNLQTSTIVKQYQLSEKMRKHLEKSGYLDKRENL